MQIIQVVPRIANESSGPSISVPSLCRGLVRAGVNVQLMTLKPEPKNRIFEQLVQFPTIPFFAKLGVSPRLKAALRSRAEAVEIIHSNSLWMMPNIYTYLATRNRKTKLVVSPRGTLSTYALSRSKWKKRFMWYFGQGKALLRADCLHATSLDELECARKMGYRGPIAVIQNGVDCPETIDKKTQSEHRKLLFLARIHPTKGLDTLLDVWKHLEPSYPNWSLVVAGPNKHEYALQMQQTANDLDLDRIRFVGELNGEAKSHAYNEASLYVLPTHTENFGVSIAEALAHGIPAVVFEGAPWKGLNERGAGWWVPPGNKSLETTLSAAMSLDAAELRKKGMAGRQWMLDEFNWSHIGRTMASVYEWLCGNGAKPSCVHT